MVMWLGAAVLGLVLAACGPGAVEGSAVTGVALTDGPILGTVSLNDSSAQMKSRTVSTRSDGTFSIDVADLAPPYLLKVEWQDAAGSNQLFAVSERSDNLDVNPITDVAFDVASGTSDPEEVFSESGPAKNRSTATRARALLTTLSSVLAPLFELYGIEDPITDKAAVRGLLEDVKVTKSDGIVTVTNKETGAVIFQGPLADLASGTFHADAMPDGPGTTTPPPTPATCTSFGYSAWGTCQSDNTQTRTVTSSSPTGCTGGSPVTTQACIYVPPVTACTSFGYSAWGTCQSSNTQTRTVTSSSPTGCTGGSPVTTQACTYVPPVTACTSFGYSAWGTCQSSNTQTRTVTSSSPTGCTGGSPVTTQACTYVPPIDGAALYTQYCAGCHGTSKKGSSATAIQAAIDSNRGGMGSAELRALTPAQIAAISAAK